MTIFYSVLRTLVQPYLLGNDDEWSVPELQYIPCPSSIEKERERDGSYIIVRLTEVL